MVGECVSVRHREIEREQKREREAERSKHVELEHKFMIVQVPATSNWYNLFGRLSFVYRSLFYANTNYFLIIRNGKESDNETLTRQQVMRSKPN